MIKNSKISPSRKPYNQLLLVGLMLLMSVFLISFTTAAVWTGTSYNLNENLTSYYKLDETSGTNVIDSVKNYNLTNTGATVNQAGKIGTSYSFGGDGDNITGSCSISGAFSWGGWIYRSAMPTAGQYEAIISGTTNLNGWLGLKSDGSLRLHLSNGGYYGDTAASVIGTGAWYQVIAVWDGADAYIYVNGTSKSLTESGVPTTPTINNVVIGRYQTGNYWNGKIDEIKIWERALSSTEITQVYNSGDDISYPYTQGVVTLNSPADTSTQGTLVTTNASAVVIGGANLTNATLYDNSTGTWGARNTSATGSVTNTYKTFTNSYASSQTIKWNIRYCDTDNACSFATANRTFFVDSSSPTLSITSPTASINYGRLNGNLTLNFSATDTNLDKCWYKYNNTNTTITCSTGVFNQSNFTLTSQKNLTLYANDTAGNLASQVVSWDYKIFENSNTFNSTAYETSYETYSVNLTANSSLTAVALIYNGSAYSMTNSSGVWSYSRDLPSSTIGSQSFYYRFTYAGSTINSDNSTQTVNSIFFGLCNATYTNDFLNISFKDETDLSNMNATITASTFIYYLGTGLENKTYQLVNNTENNNYLFCATPDRTINMIPYVQFASTGYPQRVWNPSITSYTSTVTNQVLYLLSSSDGIYVTFQVINSADQIISGVDVTATREISGEDVIVAAGTTSASGTVTFWLSPDFSHVFSFSKIGHDPYTYSDSPTQSSYTIILTGGSTSYNNLFQGIDYSIIPTNKYLVNDTIYGFGFNLTSSFWDIDEYGFNLRLANGTIITGDSTSTEGTQLSINYNTTNQTIVYIDFYWIIDGNYTNVTRYWAVMNSENTGFSIANFFTDLDAYLTSGLFGIDDFGRYLLVFIIIFITTGIMSYKFGLTSPIAISTILFGMVFFFDVVVGVIPEIRGIDHLLTYITSLALVLSIIAEVRRA